MDYPILLSSSALRFPPKGRSPSKSRSPTRPRLTDDILSDLSPATTLEAFTEVSGTLKASIEAASPTQRAFGIRAAIASKKIHEWVAELSTWPWPTKSSEGFEIPAAKRRKLADKKHGSVSSGDQSSLAPHDGRTDDEGEFWGCLPAQDVLRYESRVEEISEDMEDLDVEEIKSQVLETHVLPKTRPSSSLEHHLVPPSIPLYTRMDDFTAIVTATVLRALPHLSRLMALMDVWSVRLAVLRQVPPLMAALDDADIALRSGWKTIHSQIQERGSNNESTFRSDNIMLSRNDYEIMRDVLQDKVTTIGLQLDHMLDTLEGQSDTLPEAWLDRMEAIEQDYGEWVVCSDRKVRESEWAKEASQRQKREEFNSKAAEADRSSISSHKPDGQALHVASLAGTVLGSADSGIIQSSYTHINGDATHGNTSKSMPAGAGISIASSLSPSGKFSLLDGTNETNTLGGSQYSGPSLKQDAQKMEVAEEVPASNPLRGNTANLVETLSLRLLPSSSHDPAQEALLLTEEELNPLSLPGIVSDDIGPHDAEVNSSALSPIFDGAGNEVHPTHQHKIETEREGYAESNMLVASMSTFITNAVPENKPQNLDNPSHSTNSNSIGVVESQSKQPANEYNDEGESMLPSYSKASSFGHGSADSLRRDMSLQMSYSTSTFNPAVSDHNPEASKTTVIIPYNGISSTSQEPHTPERHGIQPISDATRLPTSATLHQPSGAPTAENSKSAQLSTSISPRYSGRDAPLRLKRDIDNASQSHNHLTPHEKMSGPGIGHIRLPSSSSAISGYSTSEPSPELCVAEPTEYFKPVSPPIANHTDLRDIPDVAAPTQASFVVAATPSHTEPQEFPMPNLESKTLISGKMSQDFGISVDSPERYHVGRRSADSDLSETLSHGRKSSDNSTVVFLRDFVDRVGSPHELLVSPDTSPMVNAPLNIGAGTPIRMLPPDEKYETPMTSERSTLSITDFEEESPSLGLVRLHGDTENSSSQSSPMSFSHISKPHSLQLLPNPSFDTESVYPESPMTPGEPPLLTNVEVSPAPALSNPSKTSDDQLQQQISEILESIPARILLTSEPDTNRTSEIQQTKRRASLAPSSRPMSRAATPSFTLAPAYAKNPRPRPQNGSPEIKLYHLSRNTGEAPIKLFVRLVGEHGERVMVRVGGGWADLGEYLKEYASHHGRRSDKTGKVEIQDVPPRVLSLGSVASVSTLKNGAGDNNGSSSPISRPNSSLERPMSSLAVRKTRKSVGEETRERGYRSPSTALPHALRSSPSVPRLSETPPSASARSVSGLSWKEEESSLGLAGPKRKKVEISAENAAWVESMKEKVRMASIEKEKAEFGEMDRIGGTKRVFKKSG